MASPIPFPSTLDIQCDDCPVMIHKGEPVLLNPNYEFVHPTCPTEVSENKEKE